jgi:transcriptional regulator with XRE-family HTH domain
MSQEELAGKLNITRASLSHYETDRREPDFETLMKIADFFHVSVDYLMGRTDNEQQTLDAHVSEFLRRVELSDESVMEKFELTVDGCKLTPEETKRFIAFIRAERSLK